MSSDIPMRKITKFLSRREEDQGLRIEDQVFYHLSEKVMEKAKQEGLRVKLDRIGGLLEVEVWKDFVVEGMDDFEEMRSYKEKFNSGGNDGIKMEYKSGENDQEKIKLRISQKKGYSYPVGGVIENEDCLYRHICDQSFSSKASKNFENLKRSFVIKGSKEYDDFSKVFILSNFDSN
ncbi:unnamed protein product [Moneuplotes crassus]|uniref:Uncharacterized protein n=1 Tax=Euplotes crassus TaxID=5936 RepID=A0AAD2D2M3_EUPCR|nr:unnamed protein product [Moneuplotes crassus]